MFYFIEALERAACELGLPEVTARRLAIATMLGSAKLADSSDESPAVLRERVTSKGGTTYAALTHMTEARVAEVIIEAARAAARRAVELGDEFGKD